MTPSLDPLAALAELERRFNGPVPEAQRLAAQLGSAELFRLRQAEAQAAFLRTLFRRQLRLIRQRRAGGSLDPSLLDDLRLYRRRWRHWRYRAQVLRQSLAANATAGRAVVAAE
jgi:hypothetical protein